MGTDFSENLGASIFMMTYWMNLLSAISVSLDSTFNDTRYYQLTINLYNYILNFHKFLSITDKNREEHWEDCEWSGGHRFRADCDEVSTHSTENSKHMFPEMKPHGLVPNFFIYISVSDLHIDSHNRSSADRSCKYLIWMWKLGDRTL